MIPELVNVFLSGFIFMSIYVWIKNKNIDISSISIWSLFISVLIKTFYSLLHSFILIDYDFDENLKIFVYVVTASILPFIIVILQNTNLFKYFLFKSNKKSINTDIFDDLIDYDKRTTMQVYLKDSDIMYIGTFKLREEKGNESFLALTDYASLNVKTKKVIFKPDDNSLKSSVVINLQNIERIEIIYDKNSELLSNLSLSNKSIFKSYPRIKPFDIEKMCQPTKQNCKKVSEKTIDLSDNANFIDLGNGYGKIVQKDSKKIYK